MSPKRILSFRIDAEKADQLDQYASSCGWLGSQKGVRGGDHDGKDTGRSALIVYMIDALLENRMTIQPKPNPFPMETVPLGSHPDTPALIAFTPNKGITSCK